MQLSCQQLLHLPINVSPCVVARMLASRLPRVSTMLKYQSPSSLRTYALVTSILVMTVTLLGMSGYHANVTNQRISIKTCSRALGLQKHEMEMAIKEMQGAMEASIGVFQRAKRADAAQAPAATATALSSARAQLHKLDATPARTRPADRSSNAAIHAGTVVGPNTFSKRSVWHGTIQDSAAQADALLRSAGVLRVIRPQRIYIPLLTNHPDRLCRMTQLFHEHVAPYNNTADIFVFSVGNTAEATYMSQCGNSSRLQNIFFMAVREYWLEPSGTAQDSKLWSYPYAGAGYRLMGHWRLLFPFTLGDILGYRYAWQLDDDSDFLLPVKTNLIEWMQQGSYLMAARKAYQDVVEVTWGLPELARAFLVAERYVPVGPLLSDHVVPAGLAGLFTLQEVSQGQQFTSPQNRGWDRMVINGNCFFLDLDVWFQPLIQRWIELVVNSGYHYRFRWNEQSVIGMTWQMFIPRQQFAPLPIAWQGYKHAGIFIPDDRDCNQPFVHTISCLQPNITASN